MAQQLLNKAKQRSKVGSKKEAASRQKGRKDTDVIALDDRKGKKLSGKPIARAGGMSGKYAIKGNAPQKCQC